MRAYSALAAASTELLQVERLRLMTTLSFLPFNQFSLRSGDMQCIY